MLTAILKEIDQVKYCVEPPSRSRVRVAIHDTFDEEMHFLAHPFGDDWLKLVRDHFASLVAASRDKLSSYAKPHDTLFSSSPFEVVGESAHALPSGTTQLNERSSSSSKKEADLDITAKMSYPSYPQASSSNSSRQASPRGFLQSILISLGKMILNRHTPLLRPVEPMRVLLQRLDLLIQMATAEVAGLR